MKALRYYGKEDLRVERVPDPQFVEETCREEHSGAPDLLLGGRLIWKERIV